MGRRWRGSPPALVSAGVGSPAPLPAPLGGPGSVRNWRLLLSPPFALPVCAKGPGQLPGGGGAGTAAIQVAGAHLQLRGTRLGGKVRPSFGAGGVWVWFFPPRRGLPASPGTRRGEPAALGLRKSPCLCLPSGPVGGGRRHAQPVCLLVGWCSRPSPVLTLPRTTAAFLRCDSPLVEWSALQTPWARSHLSSVPAAV